MYREHEYYLRRAIEVFACGQKDIKVEGPFPEVEEEAAEVHKGYWD